ncbi:MAG: PAS domain S-box protein [Dechloromonas sp.]|nr:PAS domain S-box protein [Dechloromonas sp.]
MTDTPRQSTRHPLLWSALRRVVLPYVILASLWILLSDELLHQFPLSTDLRHQFSLLKGWFFVLITAGLLTLLLHRLLKRHETGRHAERQALLLAERALRKLDDEKTLLRRVLDAAPDLIWLKDVQGIYLACNERVEQLYGTTEQHIIGKSDADFVSPDIATHIRQSDAQTLEASVPINEQSWQRFASDGHRELLYITKAPIRDAHGRLLGIIGIGRNITLMHQLQERFAVAFNASPAAISLSTLDDGIFLDVNPRYCALVGQSREALLGQSALSFHFWPNAAARLTWRNELQQKGRIQDYRTEWLAPDGQGRAVSLSSEIIALDAQPFVLSFIIDISEHQAAERQVRQLQSRLATAFSAAPVAACITRVRDGRLIDVNQRLLTEYAWTRDELIGKTTLEAGLWGRQEDRIRMVEQLQRDGRIHDFESIGVGRDGRKREISFSAEPIELDGEAHMVVYIADISERRAAERALREREELYRGIFSYAQDGICLVNPDTLTVVEINDAGCQLIGYTREETTHLRLSDLEVNQDQTLAQQLIADVMARGQKTFETPYRHRDGSRLFARVAASVVHLANRPHINFIWQDITRQKKASAEFAAAHQELEVQVAVRTAELRKARDAAEASNRAKSAFLANMSHEIRTPMNAIIGLTHLSERNTSDPAQRERLVKVGQAAHHLLGIINQILDLSKIEAGKLEIDASDFSLRELLDNTLSMISDAARAKGLTLRTELDPQLPDALQGDPLRIGQILLNFLSNALKFTQDGEILLSAQLLERKEHTLHLQLSVSDTGPGLSAEEQVRLFEPFEQADSSTTRAHGGTGLGLAIARRLAGLMGGDTGVDSQPGDGCRFWFSVQVTPGRQEKSNRLPTQTDNHLENQLRANGGQWRLLLTEDNLINQEVASDLLRQVGLSCDLAVNGHEAVKMAGETRYDLILMDIQMPEMDGLSATRALRAAGHQMPIIAMTANAFGEDRQRCLAAGMNDHLGKPVDPATLYRKLLDWLPSTSRPPVQPATNTPPPSDEATGSDEPLRTALAAVPGVDLATGLRTTRGRLSNYCRLLRHFLDSHGDDAQRLSQALSEHRPDDLQRLVHNLKGVSGTLGLNDIFVAAKVCNDHLHNSSSPPEASQVAPLQHALQHTLVALRAVLDHESPPQ